MNEMSGEKWIDFVEKLGGKHEQGPSFLRFYADSPELEPRICLLLGLQTEEEKRTQAVIESGKRAKYALIIAAISLLISLERSKSKRNIY